MTTRADLLALIARLEAAKEDDEWPQVDPHNPWPIGCPWWHMHNEIARQSRNGTSSCHKPRPGTGLYRSWRRARLAEMEDG